MIIQQALEQRITEEAMGDLKDVLSALEIALAAGDPTGKIDEALCLLRHAREQLEPKVAPYDQRLHG